MIKWLFLSVLIFSCKQETLIYKEEQQQQISMEIYVIQSGKAIALKTNSSGKYQINTNDTITLLPRFTINQTDSSYISNNVFDSFQNYFWYEKNNLEKDIVYQKEYVFHSKKARTEEIIFTIIDAVGDTLSTNAYLDITNE
jgi:hypothetical protein